MRRLVIPLLTISLFGNLLLGLYALDLKGPRLLAKLRAEVNANETCEAKLAALDHQWARYVATQPPVVVAAPQMMDPPLAERQMLRAQENFYSEAAREIREQRFRVR